MSRAAEWVIANVVIIALGLPAVGACAGLLWFAVRLPEPAVRPACLVVMLVSVPLMIVSVTALYAMIDKARSRVKD